MKKTILSAAITIASMMYSGSIKAQKTGTIDKYSYPIYGNYIGTWKSGVYILYSETDSVKIYAKIKGDTLYTTEEGFRKGQQTFAINKKIAYKHSNIKISEPDKDSFYDYQITVKSNYDESNHLIDRFYKTHESRNSKSNTMTVFLRFSSKENSDAFYKNLKNGTSTESSSSSPSTSNIVAKEEKTEVKINIKNATSDVLELYYQKNAGTKDNNSFRIQKGQSDDVKLCVGCSIFYNVKNSHGPLLLTATKEMDGTTKTIK